MSDPTLPPKVYLGDGAYAAFDGYALVLTTEDGIRATNTVVLEPEVYAQLVKYARQLGWAVLEGRR